MNKFLGSKAVCLLLVSSFVMPIAVFHDVQTHSLPYTETKTTKECGCHPLNEYTPTSLQRTEPKLAHDFTGVSSKPLIGNTPDYFSWRDYQGQDWTTNAKDQGNCGSCWDFAALGALESIIKIREGYAELPLDLSEQYVLSCLPRAGSCEGGLAYRAFYYIMKNTSSGNYCNGIIPEFCFPYQANDTIDCSAKNQEWEEFLIPISGYGQLIPTGSPGDIEEAIKTQVMTSGPVVATMMATYYPHGDNNLEKWGWEHHDPNDYYPYPGPIEEANHQVVIVGWKDNPAIGNGGYWIVKNSFSEEWGYEGFFNIEYGSLNIENYAIDWVDYDPKNFSNWIPLANANGAYYGTITQGITFDANNSYDHEGEIISYQWNFGDGTSDTGIVATHTYSQQGIYPITLSVIDNEGNTGKDTTWAFIDKTNSPPDTPTLSGPARGRNGTTYKYTFSAIDPDGDDVYYYLVWGDTYWEGWWEGWIGPYASGEKVTLENSWYDSGNYTARVKAKDLYDAKSDWATLDIRMQKNKAIDHVLAQFIERYPHLLLVLRLLQSIG